MTRIAMWSGPRNLSTAMMRSWENRADTEVLDEPLYAAYLQATGLDHPGRDDILAAGPIDDDEAIAVCLAAPSHADISYQKHMAHHLHPGLDRSWIAEFRNCLLLRDPRRVLASYTKVRGDAVTLVDIGIPQQLELVEQCEIVIDAADFLADPRAYQIEICRRLGVPFDEAMLAWPHGPRPTDGVWAKHWYASVEASTGFGAPPSEDAADVPEHMVELADEAVESYATLRRRRLLL